MSFKVNKAKGLEVYVYSDFAGQWDKSDSLNSDIARSRQVLSTTEAEYTGLSHALRGVIPIINLLE